jgi:hypothetical protein
MILVKYMKEENNNLINNKNNLKDINVKFNTQNRGNQVFSILNKIQAFILLKFNIINSTLIKLAVLFHQLIETER